MRAAAIQLLLALVALSARAQCVCPGEPIKWEYKHVTDVFIGTVTEVREAGLEADLALIEHRRHWWNTRLSSISFYALRYWWRWR